MQSFISKNITTIIGIFVIVLIIYIYMRTFRVKSIDDLNIEGLTTITSVPKTTTSVPETTTSVPITITTTTSTPITTYPRTTYLPITLEPTTSVPITITTTTSTPITTYPPTTYLPITLEPTTLEPTTLEPTIEPTTTALPITNLPTLVNTTTSTPAIPTTLVPKSKVYTPSQTSKISMVSILTNKNYLDSNGTLTKTTDKINNPTLQNTINIVVNASYGMLSTNSYTPSNISQLNTTLETYIMYLQYLNQSMKLIDVNVKNDINYVFNNLNRTTFYYYDTKDSKKYQMSFTTIVGYVDILLRTLQNVGNANLLNSQFVNYYNTLSTSGSVGQIQKILPSLLGSITNLVTSVYNLNKLSSSTYVMNLMPSTILSLSSIPVSSIPNF
jgi:hypothetical protein